MNTFIKKALTLTVSIMIFSLFFVALYLYDNKYTHKGTQPANGLIALTEQDMEKDPIRYLIHDWIFYPDVLLSPEDFKSGAPDSYKIYTNIGEHVTFSTLGNQKDPHGSGTYVLYMNLPPGKAVYALDLPEIFSAYRLYINGFPYLQLGNPDPGHYEPQTQRRMVNFEADGEATIILAVSDFSGFYSGLVYPPAFGTPAALADSRDMLLGISLFCDTIALAAAAFALYLSFGMKQKNSFIFSLTCITMCCFTSYALFHSKFSLPIFPWYGLELGAGYLLTFFVILLHNRICEVNGLTSRISATASAVFCLFAFTYGLSAEFLTIPYMRAFSIAVFLYKAAVTAYLLITAGLSLKKQEGHGEPLFYASVFYATAFAWDRILPYHEPIFTGWFSEWGSVVLIFTIGYTLWRDITSAYAYSLAFAEEHRQVTRQLAMQTEYSKQIYMHDEEHRKLAHDFRQHMRAITGLALRIDQKDKADTACQELLQYLEQLTQTISVNHGTYFRNHIFSTNTAADALLQYYYAVCSEHQITASFQFKLPDKPVLNDVELCTILGNLLENGVEACQKLEDTPRTISIITANTKRRCIIQVNNTYDGNIRRKGNYILSRKSEGFRLGIGLESVREIVERNGGDLMFDLTKEIFSVGVSLPIPDNKEDGESYIKKDM